MWIRFLVGLVILWGALSRVIWLDCLPGVNGDEALVPVQAYRLVHGLPATWYVNPGDRPQICPCLWPVAMLFSLTGTTEFWYLRVPTVLGSLLSCLAIWRGWGKLLGAAAPWVALLLWSMPVEIMFSRFGWDPSLMSMSNALLGAALLGGKPLWIVLAILLGVLNHPFYLIMLPIVPLLWIALQRPNWLKPALLLAQVGGWTAVLLTYLLGHALGAPEPAKVNFLRYCAGFPDLLSGQATFAYLVDPSQHPLGSPLAYLLGLALVVALNALPWLDRQRARPLLAALGGSLWLSLGGLFLALGTQGVVTPNERNALMLVLPLVCWLVMRLSLLVSPQRLRGILLMLSLGGLGLCVSDYFYPLRVYGNNSHRAFMCAPEEPRRTAFRQACRWLRPGAFLITDDWHNFQPVSYLALPYQIPVLNIDFVHRNSNLRDALQSGCVLIAHAYSPIAEEAKQSGLPLQMFTVQQAGGREVIQVFALAPR